MPLGTSSAFAICNIPNLYTNFRCNFFDKNEIEPPYMVALLLCAIKTMCHPDVLIEVREEM